MTPRQEDRIPQGIKSGELTKKEAISLERKVAYPAKMEKELKEDGSLSAEDRARIQHRLDRLSTDIYRQKHNAQEQPK